MVFVRLGLWVYTVYYDSTNGEIIVSHEIADGEKPSEGEREIKPKRYNKFVYFRDLFLYYSPYLYM